METFVNVVLGETYKIPAVELKANLLQKNVRNYENRNDPEKLSIADGMEKLFC